MTRRRGRPHTADRGGVAAPQQKPRQREEHRDRKVEPAEESARDPAGVARLECDVGDDDTDRGACAHALKSGQEITSPAYLCAVGHDDQCAVLIRRVENG